MLLALAILASLCACGLVLWFPTAATVAWILLLESSPDVWAAGAADNETIIGGLKGAGLLLVAALALRRGLRTDRYNPSLAFLFMFVAGVAHGMWPGLSAGSSLRSLIGSAAPFAFGFVRPTAAWLRAVVRAVTLGPACTVLFGLLLAAAGHGHVYTVEQGAFRLGASGEPAFLAGYALTAIYAGLMQWLQTRRRAELALLLLNFVILVLTGARTPLAIAAVLLLAVLLAQGRIVALAAVGAAACLLALFAGSLGFIRAVGLVQLGEAADLSNRNLVWPHFTSAIAASPWLGWGVGAGKVVVPIGSSLGQLIGTNAAHNEYLRIGVEGGILGLALLLALLVAWTVRGTARLPRGERWLMRLVMLGFALHSATDNTLIATTSSVFFIWVSAIFHHADRPATETA